MTVIEQEAVLYLKQRKGYKRILGAIVKKYQSLGRLSGFIVLESLSDEEAAVLAPLDYQVMAERRCKISVQKFISYFCEGKFAKADFMKILEAYYGSKIETHKVKKEQVEQKKQTFYQKITERLNNTAVKKWFRAALDSKESGYYLIHSLYSQDKAELQDVIEAIDRGQDLLEKKEEEWFQLPLLASQTTGNAHYFDLNKTAGKLLLYELAFKAQRNYPEDLQAINQLLESQGIIRDEISNSTVCYGINAIAEGVNKPWHLFWELGEPLQLSLCNLKGITKITAPDSRVYIVENPTVFTSLLEVVKRENAALICTSGQINTSAYKILDYLKQSGTVMYYNGDFDPEGLQIADKLKKRYKDQLQLWHYEVTDYLRIKGRVSVEERISKLESVESEELMLLADEIKKQKMAGYQELLINQLSKDIEAS